ncbi:extensin family protein [Pseudorhizobium flavum]|uniref:extensin-like domain-containing protein n=1 Tax=Pseudorhizobium flavum TaxID=1335061 RepID=UPI0024916B8A|nr:extensin family protein [Pseudorhizobium flavum]
MLRPALVLLLALPLLAAALPRNGPIPLPKPAVEVDRQEKAAEPETPAEAPSTGAAAVPTPEPKPETQAPAAPSPASEHPSDTESAGSPPEEGSGGESPPPTADGREAEGEAAKERPEKETEQKGEEPQEPAKEPPPPPPPPIAREDPKALTACLADLAALETKYETAARIDDGEGCGIAQPLEVAEVLPGVDTGGAQMRCETARALAHWLKDTVNPALNVALPGRKIAGLTTGSTYACRLRNGAAEGKISEHARGNAIDIAAFRLDDGTEITMKPRAEDGTMEGAFQRTASAGACLHFSTVLSPGSDAAHQDHLHLDVLERDSGYRYCR